MVHKRRSIEYIFYSDIVPSGQADCCVRQVDYRAHNTSLYQRAFNAR